MRIAYADPPYIGQANKYPEKREVDHAALIRDLQGYDGWALSASSPSLQTLVPLLNAVTTDYRIGAWVKPFAVFKPNVNPAYAWEPVIFHSARRYDRSDLTVRDWVSECITLERGVVGAKPDDFCMWLFRILGATPEDDFYDLFPGSGAVRRNWERFCEEMTMKTPITSLDDEYRDEYCVRCQLRRECGLTTPVESDGRPCSNFQAVAML